MSEHDRFRNPRSDFTTHERARPPRLERSTRTSNLELKASPHIPRQVLFTIPTLPGAVTVFLPMRAAPGGVVTNLD